MFGKEPAIILNALSEVVRAVIPLLLVFEIVKWTDPQTGAVLLVVGVVIGFLTTLLTRSQVVPTETANSQIATAIRMPAGSTVKEVIAKEEADK